MTRIAMWSGPRNLSTAMMYSFGARADCAVWDEPYYAAYLLETDLNHPMREQILAAWPHSPAEISTRIVGDIPQDKSVFYQKHMTQHMLPKFDRAWITHVTNVFLIRHPARVIASYHAKRESPSLADLGFQEQAELFDQVAQHLGYAPIVIDSADIRANPEAMLRALCHAIALPFDPAMLNWPKRMTGHGHRIGIPQCGTARGLQVLKGHCQMWAMHCKACWLTPCLFTINWRRLKYKPSKAC